MSLDTTGGRKVALVTGAGYGIGAATAAALAEDGFDLAVTELSGDALDETLRSVRAAGREGVGIVLDLRDPDDMEKAMNAAVAAFGHVDVLVNNAGIPLSKPALEVGYDEFSQVMAVNVSGSYFMAQQMARHLTSTRRQGAIVNLASTFTVIGVPNVSPYGISKAAIGGMTRHLAIEWAELGIRVNAVAPGAVETKLRKAAFDADPEFRDRYRDKVPMKRFATPQDVAAAVSYLASPAAAYVTGHVLVVDGGLTVG